MSALSDGRSEFEPRWRPRNGYLIDQSLGRRVAESLRRCGWNRTVYVADLFAVADNMTVADPDIIRRCAEADLAWITADPKARYTHAPALKQYLIHVLWVHRPRTGMGAPYMLATIAAALGHFDCLIADTAAEVLHCEVRPPVTNRVVVIDRLPKLLVTESSGR